MAAAITCASCKRPLRVPETVLGRVVQCPLCLEEFVAQADPIAEAAARAVEAPRKRAAARAQPIAAPIREEPATDFEEFEEAAAWVELHTETSTPSNPAQESRPIRRLAFPVLVSRDPDRLLRGRMDAELTPDGLYLRKPRRTPAFAPVGGEARYLGANRLSVTVEGREVELRIVKPWTSVYHLAHDVAGFLSSGTDFPNGRAYEMPWHLYALPAVFAALPIAAYSFDLWNDDGLGVFLWSIIAAVLAAAAYMVVLHPRRLPRTRLAGVGGLIGLGAVVFLIAFFLAPSSAIEASLWRTYMPPDGDFRVKLPGSPLIIHKPNPAFMVIPEDVAADYTVDLKQPDVRFIISVYPILTTDAGFHQWPAGKTNKSQAINDAKVRIHEDFNVLWAEGREGAATPSSRLPDHELTYRVGPDLSGKAGAGQRTLAARIYVASDRTYTLIVVGPKVRANSADALKFFDSFQITNH